MLDLTKVCLSPGGLLSTKVWLKRGAQVATGVGVRAAAQVSAEAVDTTDFTLQKLQDADLIDVLVHGYLGIIFGEAGWPFPEVINTNFLTSCFKVFSILPSIPKCPCILLGAAVCGKCRVSK